MSKHNSLFVWRNIRPANEYGAEPLLPSPTFLIIRVSKKGLIKMGKRKEITYEEVYKGFLEKGLQLDINKNDFKDQYTKMLCHCIKHPDTPLYYQWQYVRLGRFSCKQCNKENEKYHTYESIDERIDNINKNTKYTYISGMTKRMLDTITVKCEHGHEFNTTYNSVKRDGVDCPFCIGKVPASYWNVDTCQQWLNENNINYKVLNFKHDPNGNRVKIHCNNPKHKAYWTTWSHIQEGNRCKQCYYDENNKQDWTLELAKEKLNEFGLNILDERLYISSHKRIPCIDKNGFILMVSIHYLNRGRTQFSLWKGNPYVVHNINKFCELYRPDYEFISQEYYGNKNIHRWKYNGDFYNGQEFEREFDMTFGAFINSFCKHPMLSLSNLEINANKILSKYNIKYSTQKTFNGCKNKVKLRFDFYLDDYNICIETDGMQHERPVEVWGGLEALNETIKKDNIKNKFCKDNNIPLIRIPQSKMNHMEEILLSELKKLNIDITESSLLSQQTA